MSSQRTIRGKSRVKTGTSMRALILSRFRIVNMLNSHLVFREIKESDQDCHTSIGMKKLMIRALNPMAYSKLSCLFVHGNYSGVEITTWLSSISG